MVHIAVATEPRPAINHQSPKLVRGLVACNESASHGHAASNSDAIPIGTNTICQASKADQSKSCLAYMQALTATHQPITASTAGSGRDQAFDSER